MLKLCILVLLMGYSGMAIADSPWDSHIKPMEQAIPITVHHDPHCGCCTSWIKHLEKHGFKVTSIKDSNMAAFKTKKHIPANMESCHTATVGDYVIEGHVPADDIKTLIRSQDSTIYGLSVPEMPVGTPGMEMGTRKDPFAVISFDKKGKASIYKEYHQY